MSAQTRLITADSLLRMPNDGMRRERVEAVGEPEGFWPGAPDLAVEVVSPSDSYRQVQEEVLDRLQVGALFA